MYRLIISDDEIFIHKGLCHNIDWKKLGFELVASFEDGTDVIKYIESNPVDVILSDIVMCNKGGLEIAKYIAENHLPIEIVLMSGYQEFQYAHAALKYHVYDYLLKPVSIEEICEKFKALKEELDKKNPENVEETSNDSVELSDCITNIQAVFMQKLWHNQIIKPQMVKIIAEAIGFKEIFENDIVIFMCQCSSDEVIIKNHINIIFESIKSYGYYASVIDDNHILVMFSSNSSIDENNKIRQATALLSGNELHFSFAKKKKLSLSEFKGEIADLTSLELLRNVKNSVSYLQMLDGNKNIVSKITVLYGTISNELTVEILRLCIEVFLFEIYPVNLSDALIQRLFSNFEFNYGDIQDTLKRLYDRLVLIHNGPFNGSYDFAIEKVQKYIKKHLHEDISVGTLADILHLNAAYFGRYFKKTTFMTVKQYIHDKRMELAIDLLAQKKYNVVEIAKMVGCDFKYFFHLFKKYTGYTPKEYLKYFID